MPTLTLTLINMAIIITMMARAPPRRMRRG